MSKIITRIISISILGLLFLVGGQKVAADQVGYSEQVYRAKVLSVVEEGSESYEIAGEMYSNRFQLLKIGIIGGLRHGEEILIEHGGQYSLTQNQELEEGDEVVLTQIDSEDGEVMYQVVDKYRVDQLLNIIIIFFVLVVMLSKWKGVGSFAGMLVSLYVIVQFIVPRIIEGQDPLRVSIMGSLIILVTTIYLAHGFSKQTSVAVLSTSITLIVTGLLSVWFVQMSKLSGLGSDEASTLQFGLMGDINFKGLLLGGMIIGFLGVLDDVTTGIAATVFELKKVNKKLKVRELISSSMTVGREHISSLVNTLVLAYAGASLPIFLFIVLNTQGYPVWYLINNEMIAEEIVRTLVGSIGLLFAVPITAVLASIVVDRES